MLNLSKKSSKARSQNERAVLQRNRRIKNANTIRFNEPLKEFVQLKYSNVYKEYETLYEYTIAEGSRKWKLTSTDTFKQWKKTILKDNEALEEPINTITATELTPLEEPINTITTTELYTMHDLGFEIYREGIVTDHTQSHVTIHYRTKSGRPLGSH